MIATIHQDEDDRPATWIFGNKTRHSVNVVCCSRRIECSTSLRNTLSREGVVAWLRLKGCAREGRRSQKTPDGWL